MSVHIMLKDDETGEAIHLVPCPHPEQAFARYGEEFLIDGQSWMRAEHQQPADDLDRMIAVIAKQTDVKLF